MRDSKEKTILNMQLVTVWDDANCSGSICHRSDTTRQNVIRLAASYESYHRSGPSIAEEAQFPVHVPYLVLYSSYLSEKHDDVPIAVFNCTSGARSLTT